MTHSVTFTIEACQDGLDTSARLRLNVLMSDRDISSEASEIENGRFLSAEVEPKDVDELTTLLHDNGFVYRLAAVNGGPAAQLIRYFEGSADRDSDSTWVLALPERAIQGTLAFLRLQLAKAGVR